MPERPSPYTLADAWRLNNRVNLMLLDALSEEQLAVAPSARARGVADQFAHLHNIRIMWLEPLAPAAAAALKKIPKGPVKKAELRQALEASAGAVAAVLEEAEKIGRIKVYKRGPAAFFAYAVAHEAHHRGQIVLHLKNTGKPVDKTLAYGIWEWEKI